MSGFSIWTVASVKLDLTFFKNYIDFQESSGQFRGFVHRGNNVGYFLDVICFIHHRRTNAHR